MKLKDNFTKKDISNPFKIIKDKSFGSASKDAKAIPYNTEKTGLEETLKDKLNAFLKREKAIWAELGYGETLAQAVEAWDKMNTRRIFAAGGAVIAIGMAAFTFHVATQPNAFLLEIDGTQVGYVESQEIVDEVVVSLEDSLKQSLGVENVTIKEGTIACTATREKKLSLLDEEAIEQIILDADVCDVDAWTITVDGKAIAAAATEDLAKKVLEDVTNSYKTDGAEIVSFSYKENVAVTPDTVKAADVMEADKAVSFILTGTEEPKTYTVQDGDTLWDIAFANGMKPAELVAANPDFEPDKLKIGQVLNLVAIKPYMTVNMTEKVVAKEAIPFETVYEDDKTLTRGKTKVKTAGANGQKEVVSQVVRENGRIVSTAIVSETVVSQPVTQVASRGTKVPVYTASATSAKGTGIVGHPLSTINPSKNGGMYGASRGGRRHVGVDLRSSLGAPIYAAEGGTVTTVSSTGSYGKLIVINHGGGLVTKYAHCNSIGVTAGQKVQKGEQIGTVGNTGNATGYILHFEVLVNGSNVNPLNYL